MVKAPEDIEEVVIRANSVMFLAISEARFRYIDPPPKERKALMNSLATIASNALKALGYDPEVFDFSADEISDLKSHQLSILQRSLFESLRNWCGDRDRDPDETAIFKIAKRSTGFTIIDVEFMKEIGGCYPWTSFDKTQDVLRCGWLLDNLPVALALIREIALNSKIPKYYGQKTNFTREFIGAIFRALSKLHFYIMKRPLQTANRLREPRGPSTIWAACMLKIAVKRLAQAVKDAGDADPRLTERLEDMRKAIFEAHRLDWAAKARPLSAFRSVQTTSS